MQFALSDPEICFKYLLSVYSTIYITTILKAVFCGQAYTDSLESKIDVYTKSFLKQWRQQC